VAAAPVLLARGRHAITDMPDGSWVIRHAAPLCETCASCGCGEQQPPITIPAMLVELMKAHGEGRRIGVAQLRRLMSMAIGGIGAAPGEDNDDSGS
jgi:hypothetical protein